MPAAETPEANEDVRIADYDATWPLRFEAERAALAERIGPWVTGGIHHVGSTGPTAPTLCTGSASPARCGGPTTCT